MCPLQVGIEDGIVSLENSLAVSFKLNTNFPHRPAIKLLGIYPRKMKTCLHKTCTQMNVHSSFICNNPKLDMYFQCAIQMYFKGGMDKQSVIHLYNRILLDNKKI